jgi:hypothetical protein
MTEADQKREDDVLRRMLNTPPQSHKEMVGRQSSKVTRPKNERVTPASD